MLAISHSCSWLLLTCGIVGCWQEVHYESSEKPPATPNAAIAEADRSAIDVSNEPESLASGEPVDTNLPLEAVPSSSEIPSIVKPTPGTSVEAVAEAEEEVLADDLVAEDEERAADPFWEEEALAESDDSGEVEASTEANLPASNVPASNVEVAGNAETALAVWEMSSAWSMAAALRAKGVEAEGYGMRLKQAQYNAIQLGITLPAMPDHPADTDRLQEMLSYLLESSGPQLASDLSKIYGTDHAALAELATKTNVLLLSYSPNSKRLNPVIDAIRQAAVESGLPESVWRELVDLLTARAEFKQVKAAIYELHRQATDSLATASLLE